MMRKILLLIGLICLAACSKHTFPRFDYNNGPNSWINAFKDRVFFNSLRESYKSDTIFKLIEKKDAFNPYEGLGPDAINKAKLIAIELVRKMPPPTMCENCTKDMNYYMANALHFYNSKQLDSIAIQEYKKYLKQMKEE